jgi:predicted MFS family arabinose efflux permease
MVFAPSMPSVLVLRALSGAFAAGIIPISMAYVGDTVSYEQRQPALAKFMTATLTGMICGQWLGGVLAEAVHWRAPFAVVTVVFVVAAGLMMRAGLVTRGAVGSGGPDASVVAVSADGGSGSSSRQGDGAPTSPAPAVPSPARSRVSYTAQLRDILGRPWAWVVLLTVFAEGATTFSIFALVPTHLNQRFGIMMSMAGAMLAMSGLGGLVYALSASRLVRRFGEGGLASLGGVLLGAGFLLLALEGRSWLAAPACLVGGLGLYMLHNTLQTNATQLSSSYRGTAVSLFASCLFVGQSVGVTVAASLVGAGLSRWMFAACAVFTPLLGFAFAAAVRRRAGRTTR